MAYSTIRKTTLKKAQCKQEGCPFYPAMGLGGYCSEHADVELKTKIVSKRQQQRRSAAKRSNLKRKLHLVQREVSVPKKALKRQNTISKVSKNMLKELKIYNPLRKQFLKDNPICKCGRNGCKRKSVDVHHMKGRGIYLNAVEFWLPVARVCHNWIGDNPKEAMELGLTISRLNV